MMIECDIRIDSGKRYHIKTEELTEYITFLRAIKELMKACQSED